MTTNEKLAHTTEYLIEIEQLFYNAGENIGLTEEENNSRKNLHKWAYEFLTTMKMKALEGILKEEEETK